MSEPARYVQPVASEDVDGLQQKCKHPMNTVSLQEKGWAGCL